MALPDEAAPKEELQEATPRKIKDPPPRLTPQQIHGVRRALDIWALLGNPTGNPPLGDNLFYDEEAMSYARQGKFFFPESQRAKNFTRTSCSSLKATANRKVFLARLTPFGYKWVGATAAPE